MDCWEAVGFGKGWFRFVDACGFEKKRMVEKKRGKLIMGMVGMRSVHERAVGLQARDLGESG